MLSVDGVGAKIRFEEVVISDKINEGEHLDIQLVEDICLTFQNECLFSEIKDKIKDYLSSALKKRSRIEVE